jgi:hypothetical protein
MNEKKNNLAWYQRTYFNIVKSLKILVKIFNFKSFLFTFIILLFLKFFVFDKSVTYCFNKHLDTHLIGGYILYFSGKITHINAVEALRYMNSNQFDFFNCVILKPNQLCINTFSYTHPYRHFNLNILPYNNIIGDFCVNIQMSSHNFNNCSLLSYNNIEGRSKPQFIANNFYFYPKNDIQTYFYNFDKFKTKLYLDDNKDQLNKHISSVISKYRI